MKKLLIGFAILLVMCGYSYAATVEADSCSLAHVQAAHDAADRGDTLVGSWSTGDTVSTDTFIQLSGTIGGSVTSGNWYWVCALAGPNALSIAQNTSGTRTLYYNYSSSYSSPPSTLSGTWSSQASRDWGLYVEIQ